MKYDDIIQLINDSYPKADWEVIDKEKIELYYYKGDVNLRLESNDFQSKPYDEDWIKNIPIRKENKPWVCFFSLYYNSTLLKRFYLIWVDGARACLPIPDPETMKVKKIDCKIAEIVTPDLKLMRTFFEEAKMKF